MFSPDAAAPSSVPARNPRRRQRTGSEDSVAIRQNPKRIRRSGLTSETFEPPLAKRPNGHLNHLKEAALVNGHAHEPGSQSNGSADASSLAIRHRGVKKVDREKRSSKHDGSIELTKNENYVVTQLATTPELLQDPHRSDRWQGDTSAHLGYAIAMTPTQALIWRYAHDGKTTEQRPLIIKLLNLLSHPNHHLPLGILVPTSAEPALLIVMPTSGKVTYWESLSAAASVDLNRQKQQSVQGTVNGMLSGEVITKTTEAEPRGFVLTFSTGRIAHLVVSDPQGKPSINVQFLRSGGAQSGGVFGSLRSVFSSVGWRRDVAAVRASSSSQRGQRYVVVATTKGSFQTWDLSWNGTHALVSDVDANQVILRALTEGTEVLHDHKERFVEVLDFTILPNGANSKQLVKLNESGECKLLALTILAGEDTSKYALVGLTLIDGSVTIDVIHPISCYKTPIAHFRPQVLVPEPAETAFVVFERSVVLVSLVEIEETPSSQLRMEAHTLPDPFQDSIDFRKDKSYKVVGCATEKYDRNHAQSSCIIMVHGFGLVRISALPVKEGQTASNRATVTAKTKIEQAVFFGSLQQDLLDFTPGTEVTFAPEKVEAAALEVSHSIMSSTSVYLPEISPSMDQQLLRRSTALADLNKHLRKHYPHVSRMTRWRLMWNAERMASGKALWRCYDTHLRNSHKVSQGKALLAELVESLHENFKAENQPEQNETDGVRHWFIHDLWRLEYIIPWAQHGVEMLFKEAIEDHRELDQATQATMISEAGDIQLAALEPAFQFREENAAAYGLDDEIMIDGVLKRGYEDLPEIWTSSAIIIERVKLLTDLSREFAQVLDHIDDEDGSTTEKIMIKLAADNPRQVQLCCQTCIERYRWLMSREDAASKASGQALMHAHFAARKVLFASLSDISRPDKGIELAEKYRDMDALVEIIDQELMNETTDQETKQLLIDRVNSNFVKFGTPWANAFFSKHLHGVKAVEILDNSTNFQQHLTKFLRNHPLYAKMGWINEVKSERNYGIAFEYLRLAQKQSTNVWSRKIALSMGKLTIMAAEAKGQAQRELSKSSLRRINLDIAILMAQEKLYGYVKRSVRDALDAEAEADLAMERYGSHFVEGKPRLREVLQRSLNNLLAMEFLIPDDLIDVLTLIDDDPMNPDDSDFSDNRFFSALQVLKATPSDPADSGRRALHERIIWRRCLIQDDWEAINRTELKDDSQVEVETGATALFKTLREGYRKVFWDKQPPIPPADILEAGTSLESLRTSTRYANNADNKLTSLAQDLQKEDDLLEKYLDKGRLEMWWRGVHDAAKAAAREEADRDGEKEARQRNSGKEFQQRLEEKDRKAYGKEGDVEVNGQGTVIMGM